MEEINKLLDEKAYYKAYSKMNLIIKKYGDQATGIKASRDKLLANPELKAEITAEMYLYQAAKFRRIKDNGNFKRYLSMLMKKYPDSKAAAKAKELWGKKN